MNKKSPLQPRAFGIAASVIGAVLIITTIVPQHSQAAAVSWTTDADFATWTHYDTIASNDSVILTKVVTHELLPGDLAVPVYGSGVIFDEASSNTFYIFGGYGDAASTPHLPMNPIQSFTSSPDTGSATSIGTLPERRLPTTIYSNKGGSRKAYVIGGVTFNTNTYQDEGDILRYNLLAPQNNPTELPQKWYEGPGGGAVLDPTVANTDEMLIFNYNRVLKYKPFLPEMTQVATLPYEWSRTEAIWSSVNNKIYLIGGSTNRTGGSWENDILEFDPTTNTAIILADRIPVEIRDVQTTYNALNNKIYFYGDDGPAQRLYEFNPVSKSVSQLSTAIGSMSKAGVALNTVTNTPYLFGDYDLNGQMSKLLYSQNNAQSGYATKVLTPAPGGIQDWSSASAGITANNGSITIEYTNDAECQTGFTSDITAVPNSESLCIRANFTATSPTLLGPSLNDLTINYNVVATPTPSPSGTPFSYEPCSYGIGTVFSTPYPSGSPSPSPTIIMPSISPSTFPSTSPTLPVTSPTPTPFGTPTYFTPTPTPSPTMSFPFPTP